MLLWDIMPPMQTLVVGDIHGCFQEFQALLDKAGLTDDDEIISLGDCVDRGPETPEVLRFFMENNRTRLVMGNHERKHVRGSRGELKLAISQRISILQFDEEYLSALQFMGELPLFIELPDAILVHGYVEPGVPLHQQLPTVLCGTMGGEKHLRDHYEQPWYELYDGEKAVLVGHKNYTKTDQAFVYQDRIFGLDTSCVTGKTLSGVLLPSFRILSVPSRGNLWMQVRRTLPRPVRTVGPVRPIVEWSEDELQVLADLLAQVSQACALLLEEIQAQPSYLELRPRKQALLFGERVGKGRLASLMHLARQDRLDIDTARKALSDPFEMKAVLAELEQAG